MWILIIYMSVGWGQGATGGPATVAGFSTKETCMATGERFKNEVPKMDWYVCVKADIQAQK